MGFSEIITYSFVSPETADLLDAEQESLLRSFVRLRNPLTVDQSVMRTSLIPGLLATLKYNLTHGESDLKLFEWGKIFHENGAEELPHEKTVLSALMSGLCARKEWHNTTRSTDFYDIKGIVEVLLNALGINIIDFKRSELESFYDPDVSCAIYVSDTRLGSIGKVLQKILGNFDIKTDSAFIVEIDLEILMKILGKNRIVFESFTRYPAVWRDLSIEVDRNVESAIIEDIIKSNGKGLIESVNIFDLYEGEKFEESKKAISFRICFRSGEGTLDGKEVNDLYDSIIKEISKKTGGKLREG
jgi:phenylalanyl-tRNA synthetase beta chain